MGSTEDSETEMKVGKANKKNCKIESWRTIIKVERGGKGECDLGERKG